MNKAIKEDTISENSPRVDEFKKRILSWSNPVEFVNNMYGSHPDDGGGEFFIKVYGDE